MKSPEHSERLKVLHLAGNSTLYGAERWVLALVNNIDAGVESWVGSIQDDGTGTPPVCAHAARMGIRTRTFTSPGRLSLRSVGELRRFIRDEQIDVLHTHGYKSDALGLLAVRGLGCRIISTPHGWSVDAGLKLKGYELFDRWLFPFFDAVVPLSPQLHEELSKRPRLRGKLHLIPNGVDLAEVDGLVAGDERLQQLKRRKQRLVGYVGQLIPRKGVETLIRAFRAIDIPGARLVIVGDGALRSALESLVREYRLEDRVDFCGFRDDRLALARCFDVLVLPSKLEGVPRCALEAMAAGVPVIASDIPGCRDLIEHGKSGLLFEVGNHEQLAKSIALLLTDERYRMSLAGTGRRAVRAGRSAKGMAARYARLYESLCSRREPNAFAIEDLSSP